MISIHCFHEISHPFSLRKTPCVQELTENNEKGENFCQKFSKRTEILIMNNLYTTRKEGAGFSPISLRHLSIGNDSIIKNEKYNETPMKRRSRR